VDVICIGHVEDICCFVHSRSISTNIVATYRYFHGSSGIPEGILFSEPSCAHTVYTIKVGLSFKTTI